MSERLPQRELRNNNAEVINRVVAGETFVVTRNGEPVAELRPLPTHRRTFVPRQDLVAAAHHGEHIDVERFRADLDRAIDQRL
ncbi:MAG: type II toxin-antitoxin system prevent-host-death family antitoxin [Actinobacteria bacterium]|nr:type II toxin-antitoxin system prevent-host-death family antitoxin [Actinomycetota bacterium]